MLVAQLSDTHLLADPSETWLGHNTTTTLGAVVDALPPHVDVMVVTGDLTENGAPDGYRRLVALTDGRAEQRYFIPGNHDDPIAMDAVLGSTEPLRTIGIGAHWTMVLLNSKRLGHEAGYLTNATLHRLRDVIARATTYVVVCVHHPPISPCPNRDCGMDDAERLVEVLAGGPVRLVLSGHAHDVFETTRRGVTYLGAPSTFRQLRHGGDPHYTDTGAPPAARLVELFDDGTFTTHVVSAPEPDR